MTVNFCLGFRCEKADIDVVGGVLVAGFGEDGGKTGSGSGKMRLKQSAIQRRCIRNEQAQVTCGEAGWQPEGDANVALRLMRRAESGFDGNGVAGVSYVSGSDARLIECDVDRAGNGLDVEIDRANDPLARAI